MSEILAFLGFVATLAVALAGWFWEFTVKHEDGLRKRLTKAGRLAFGGTVLVSSISLFALITQSIEKSRSAESLRLEKEALKTKLLQIETRIDIEHVHIFMRVDNDSPLIKKLRAGDDGIQIRASSREQSRDLTQPQIEALKELISKASKNSFYFFDESVKVPVPVTDEHQLFVLTGNEPDYSVADESAPFRWGIISWPNPKRDLTTGGYTDVDLRIPARLITIFPGKRPIGSFVDLAGSKVAAWVGPPGTLLVYARIYAKNGVSYPIFDAMKSPDGRMTRAEESGLMRTDIPKAPPWLPQ